MSDQHLIDPVALDRLRRIGKGDKLMGEMIDYFFRYVPEKLQEAHDGLAGGDFGHIGEAVHPLRSSAGHLGIREMSDLAARIEKLATIACHSKELAGALTSNSLADATMAAEIARIATEPISQAGETLVTRLREIARLAAEPIPHLLHKLEETYTKVRPELEELRKHCNHENNCSR